MIKGGNETIKNEAKEEKGRSLPIILGTIASNLLGNMSAGKLKMPESGVIRPDEGTIRAGEGL